MIDLRAVTPTDIPACLDVFYESIDELHQRTGQPRVPRNPAALAEIFGHLVGTDPGNCWLAADGAQTIAFGMAHQRDDHWYLAFLFVRPGDQSRGVGRAVLERCLPSRADRETTRLSVAVESTQPVSTALYAKYGMVPRVPLYLMVGDIRPGGLPGADAGLAAANLEPVAMAPLAGRPTARAEMLDVLDREVIGYPRPQEHALLAAARTGFLYRQGERVVAYGYAASSGRLGPVCAHEPAQLAAILGHLTSAVRPNGAWQVVIPGPAEAALLPLLEAGMRIDDAPALYCSTWEGPRFDRYLPINYALN